MIYFHIQTESGNVLASNITSFKRREELELKQEFTFKAGNKGIKSIRTQEDGLKIWFVAEDESDLLNSSKTFKKALSAYVQAAKDVWNYHKAQLEAQAHTLTTIQGQLRQKMEGFAEDENFYADSFGESVDNIQSVIASNPHAAADLICYFHKKVADMRAHLLGVEVIHSGMQYEINLVNRSLRRAILSQCSSFLHELDEKGVRVRFFFDETHEVEVDKTMFSLVMYNFFSNAAKYTAQNTEIRLNYEPEEKILEASMVSLKMEKNEIAGLSDENVRGIHAKNLPGKGLGLFVLQRGLQLMGKQRMYIRPNYEKNQTIDGVPYIENHFLMTLGDASVKALRAQELREIGVR